MNSLKLTPFLLVLAVLASCTRRPAQPITLTLTPPGSTATPILAALTPTAPPETATDIPEGSDNSVADDGWKIYSNTELGYKFHYPADASLETNPDQPADGVSVTGPESNGDHWPWIEIRHPQGQAEYNPPADVDLQQWLADHYLLGVPQLDDAQIAGITAVHLRFERSPQSYAFDRFYFARAGQLYMILIAHTGDHEDWGLYNRFLESFKFEVDP